MNKKKTKKIIREAYSKEDPMSPNVGYELPEETFRLVLTYRRGEIMRDEVLRVPMRLPLSDDLPERKPDEPLSGFWYELQTNDGEVLYRRVIGNPIRTWLDVPDEDDPTRLVHLETLPEEKTFVLDVPAFPEGAKVVLFSSPLGRPSEAAPAEPMWEIPLHRGKKRGGDH